METGDDRPPHVVVPHIVGPDILVENLDTARVADRLLGDVTISNSFEDVGYQTMYAHSRSGKTRPEAGMAIHTSGKLASPQIAICGLASTAPERKGAARLRRAARLPSTLEQRRHTTIATHPRRKPVPASHSRSSPPRLSLRWASIIAFSGVIGLVVGSIDGLAAGVLAFIVTLGVLQTAIE